MNSDSTAVEADDVTEAGFGHQWRGDRRLEVDFSSVHHLNVVVIGVDVELSNEKKPGLVGLYRGLYYPVI